MDWISVKDRLPEENVDVLMYDRYYGVAIGVLRDGKYCAYDDCGFNNLIINAEYWLPFPEPPEED